MNLLGFFKPGIWELLIILLIILLLFGATKLPKIGKSMGEAIRGFKKSVKDEDEDEDKKEEGEEKKTPPDDAPPAT